MRATATILLLGLAGSNAYVLPGRTGCHKSHTIDYEAKGNSLAASWSGVFHNVWESVRGTALGWYDVDLYDELEKTFRAPDKSVWQTLAADPKCVLRFLSQTTPLARTDPPAAAPPGSPTSQSSSVTTLKLKSFSMKPRTGESRTRVHVLPRISFSCALLICHWLIYCCSSTHMSCVSQAHVPRPK